MEEPVGVERVATDGLVEAEVDAALGAQADDAGLLGLDLADGRAVLLGEAFLERLFVARGGTRVELNEWSTTSTSSACS